MQGLQLKLEKEIYELDKKPIAILIHRDTMFDFCTQLHLNLTSEEIEEIIPYLNHSILYPDEINRIEYRKIPIYRSEDITKDTFKIL